MFKKKSVKGPKDGLTTPKSEGATFRCIMPEFFLKKVDP